MSGKKTDLADLLGQHIQEAGIGDQTVAKLATNLLKPLGRQVSRRNINNWRDGIAKTVRDWRQLAAIGNVLNLDQEKANKLFQSAGLLSVEELQNSAKEEERYLLALWGAKSSNETSTPFPWQLLEPVYHFTGRGTELKLLLEVLHPKAVVVLYGPGGIGKTALAAEAIHRLKPDSDLPKRFPDGIITHNFYEDRYVQNALIHIAHTFNVSIDPETTPTSVVRRALSGKQALLILEGAENADNLEAVLAERSQCGVLIITRKREHTVLGEKQINLSPFNTDEGIELLKKWAESQITNENIAGQICELIGGLPLAIRLAGSYMAWRNEDATGYLGWLKETPLEALDHGNRRLQSVPVLLEKSVAQLNETTRQLLEVIGVLAPAPFDQKVITEALAIPQNKIRRPLDELINYSLLDPIEVRYKVSHTLVHTYARERMEAPSKVVERLAVYYTTLVKEESKRGLERSYAALDYERLHVIAVLDECRNREDWGTTRSLARAVNDYLDIRGYWTEWMNVVEAGLTAARVLEDKQDEAAFLDALGRATHYLSRYEQAIEYYQQALVIYREIGDRHGEGIVLSNLGITYRSLGQYEQAIEYYQQALIIHREIGDRHSEGAVLDNLGIATRYLGRIDQAIEYHQQALTIILEIGDRRGAGATLSNLGNAYSELSRYEQAIQHYQQALAIAREIGNRRSEGIILGNLGNTYRNLGQYEQAIKHYQQALVIVQEIGDRRNEGVALDNLGIATRYLGRIDQAIGYYQQALAIAHELGSPSDEGAALDNLGSATRYLGQYEQAIEYHRQALVIYRKIGSRRSEGIVLGNLGTATRDLGQYEQAIEYYQQALVILHEVGDQRSKGTILMNLGLTYQNRAFTYYNSGDLEEAIDFYHQALEIRHEIGDDHGKGTILVKLGKVCYTLGQTKQAVEYYQQALVIARKIGDRRIEGVALVELGNTYRKLGQYEQAIEHYQQALVIHCEVSDRRSEGIVLGSLGTTYRKLGQYEQAIEHYQQALVIHCEVSDRRSEGIVLGNLGSAYSHLSQYEQAIKHYQQALIITREIGNRRGEGVHLANLGIIYQDLGQVEQAIEHYQQALAIFEEINSPDAKHLRKWLEELEDGE